MYCALMGCEKLLVTGLMRLPWWGHVRVMILAPVTDPRARVVLVVLVIPFFVNVSLRMLALFRPCLGHHCLL